MRGSIYYQTSILAKLIFKEGALKIDRVDSSSDSYQCVASFNTMDTYRKIWNNFGLYLREVWKVKDFEIVNEYYILDYIEHKYSEGLSKQYIEKIGSALSKLAIALQKFNNLYSTNDKEYIFTKHIQFIVQLKKDGILESENENRAYEKPKEIIEGIENKEYKLAARIQLESGTRYVGIRKIKIEQLEGFVEDEITGIKKGVIVTKEKGGRSGDIYVSTDTYLELYKYLKENKEFIIDYQKYNLAIKITSDYLGYASSGTHGFRWNFAQRRLIECQRYGLSYDESIARVSMEMKHNRKYITEHYLSQ